jgi:hypothetical protein
LLLTAAAITICQLGTTTQAPAAGPPYSPGEQIVDSKGNFVATALGARMLNNGLWYFINAQTDGFLNRLLTQIQFLHASTDCSGTQYLEAVAIPPEA